QRVVPRTGEDAVADLGSPAVAVVLEMVDVTGAQLTAREPAVTVIAHDDRPALGRRPDAGAPPEVEGLAPALEHVADQRAVTGEPAEGLEADRAAVEQLGPARCSGQGLEVGHHVHRVAVRA